MVVVATERSEVAGILSRFQVKGGLKGKDGLSLVKTRSVFYEVETHSNQKQNMESYQFELQGIEKDSFSKKSKVVFEQGRFEHHSGRALNIGLITFHVQPNL